MVIVAIPGVFDVDVPVTTKNNGSQVWTHRLAFRVLKKRVCEPLDLPVDFSWKLVQVLVILVEFSIT